MSPTGAEPMYREGDVVAGCRVVRRIGAGGTAQVYEVLFHAERQALKVSHVAWYRGTGLRMRREAEILRMIFHPNLVEVYDHGVEPNGVLWIRMALVQGRTLRQLIHDERRAHAPLSVPMAVAYLFRASQGVQQCHELGVVHRDLKPENIMVAQEGKKHQVKVLDLGMARVLASAQTSESAAAGTALYMAPEQFDPRLGVSAATDVYSLCLVLYELLAGHPFVPARGEPFYPTTMMFQHCYVTPPRLEGFGVPKPLAEVVARGLAKRPEERFADAGRFAEALWDAWEIVQATDPEVDTNPGEPSIDRILPAADQSIEFGYASAGRPRRRRSSLPLPRVESAHAEPLPDLISDPVAFDAAMERESVFFVRASEGCNGGPERRTQEIDRARLIDLVDRTREGRATLPIGTAARAGDLAPFAARPFVPVQHTEPLAPPLRRAPEAPRAGARAVPPLVRVQLTEPLERSFAPPRETEPPPESSFEEPASPAPVATRPRQSVRPVRHLERALVSLFVLVAAAVWIVAAVLWRRANESSDARAAGPLTTRPAEKPVDLAQTTGPVATDTPTVPGPSASALPPLPPAMSARPAKAHADRAASPVQPAGEIVDPWAQ